MTKIVATERVLTTKTASEKYGLGVEYLRKLLRQGKIEHWSSNPKYFFEKDLIKGLENEKKHKQSEILKW